MRQGTSGTGMERSNSHAGTKADNLKMMGHSCQAFWAPAGHCGVLSFHVVVMADNMKMVEFKNQTSGSSFPHVKIALKRTEVGVVPALTQL
jgi:hypothetical protein